ncbi:B-box zinc finger protein 32-like [Olea europaea var. sylvestris]|uniref:B-box zinc finger protein 32-like n=1 Tax=Olea europaea var. sylvestris TaxID=158386 RepID=UPI000C1D25C6|nr:B-box zinc finger protein 32-like [Olea europaea var. sylvestris]
MKKCDFCNSTARMYCESDQASLCRVCDARIHTANFLVAEHSRNLLCHTCQSPTPWNGSGARLGPSVSLCESCDLENGSIEVDEEDEDEDEDEDEEEDREEHNEEEDDANSQVVSLSSTSIPPPSPSSPKREESFTELSRGRNEVYSSNFGFPSASAVEDRNGTEKPDGEKNGS